MRLRMSGYGDAGEEGGPPGDLYVFINVEPHNFFKRNQDDIICQVPISFIQATLGAAIDVPTLKGEKKLQIAKGTQPGDVFRFKGEGLSLIHI